MSNVIKFPGVSDLPLDQNEFIERVHSIRTEYAEEAAEEAFEAVLMIARNYGFLTRQDKFNVKDMVAMSDTIFSSLLRYADVHHPMQDVIDQVIEITDDRDLPEASPLEDFSVEIPDPVKV
jgi:hypothetical protein